MKPNPFEVATTIPFEAIGSALGPAGPTTERLPPVFGSTPPPAPSASASAPPPLPSHRSGAIDVVVDDMRMSDADATHEDAAPSRADLLQRAAILGPSRMTWENIVLQPTDPVLANKMEPRVAERRARFRTMVKVALGACIALCVVGTAASALSSSHPTTASGSSTSAVGKEAPATGTTPVEKLDLPTRAKANHVVTAAVRPTPAPKFAKHR